LELKRAMQPMRGRHGRLRLNRGRQEMSGITMRADAMNDRFVRHAIELARQARLAGNHPFGSLLVLDDAVVLTAANTVNTDRDPTAHAETNLIAAAIRRLDPAQLGRATLYTSCEPCAMCAGKMYWAGIRSVVYALPSEELTAFAGRDFLVPCRELFARAAATVQVTGPVLVDEARDVHRDFWPQGVL
jgi:tRNA(Arg) A34 adenosine deaminase TadA